MAEKNLAVGSIPKLLIRLALPVLGGFLLQSAYALIDMYWVGFLGADALGGLSICLNLHLLVLTLGFTLGVSGLATISRAFGSGDRAAVPLLFQQVFWQSLTVGVAACLLTLYLAEPYFDLFTNDPGVRAEGLTFYRMFTLTFVFSTLVMAASFCWRAVGDFVTPPILMALSVVINLLLDPLLIFGWGPVPALGMEGVALATVLAQAVPFGIYLYLIFLRKQNTLLVVRRPFRVDWKIQWRLLRIGVPAGMQSLFATLAMMAVYRAGRPFGGEAAAAVGVGFRLIQAGILPMVSLASALGSVVGQNLGARLPDRIHSAVRWSLVYVLALTLSEYALLASAPEYWVRIFTSDATVVSFGVAYLTIIGLSLPLIGVGHIVTATAQGLGRTTTPLLGQGLRLVILMAILPVGADRGWFSIQGLFWVVLGSAIAETLVMLGVLRWLLHSLPNLMARGFHPGGRPGTPPPASLPAEESAGPG